MQQCSNKTSPGECFCSGIKSISCPGVCATGEGPASYLNWVLEACGGKNTKSNNASTLASPFRQQWVDFHTLGDDAYDALFPWQWQVNHQQNATVGANATIYSCPSIQAKLGSFAAINIVVFAVAAIVGRRTVVKRITFGHWGKRGDHSAVVFTAILSVVLNLVANLINAAIIRRNAGFQHVNIGNLLLLWASRPRLAWGAGLLVKFERGKDMYTSLGASAILAEVILQVIGSVYIGITGNWARRYHFYLAHRLDNVPHGQDALVMYGGALLWLVSIGLAAIMAFLTYTSVGVLLVDGLGKVGRASIRVSKYSWDWTCWLFIYSAKFIWKWSKEGAIVLGKSIRWIWRWVRIGTTKAYLYSLGSAYDHFHWNRPVVPADPWWPPGVHEPLNINPRPQFPSNIPLTSNKIPDKFLDELIIVMCFLVIPFIGQWLFWTGYLQMAGTL
ncbi:MAG: hypothetical protein M1840_002405 [Geoglossum simile]|nr:MAG: hypothetical protein M1840_002405 [Geoglossum simile]